MVRYSLLFSSLESRGPNQDKKRTADSNLENPVLYKKNKLRLKQNEKKESALFIQFK